MVVGGVPCFAEAITVVHEVQGAGCRILEVMERLRWMA